MTRQPIGQEGNPRKIGGNLHTSVAVFAAVLHPLAQRRTRRLTSRRISSRAGWSMSHRVAVREGHSAQGLSAGRRGAAGVGSGHVNPVWLLHGQPGQCRLQRQPAG